MKRFNMFISCLFILTVGVCCGRRTAPVPYDVSEPSLPKVVLQKPVYQGNRLYIHWILDDSRLDSSADSFILRIFEQTESCRYCQAKMIGSINTARLDGQTTSVRFFKQNDRYELYIDPSLHQNWQKKGLFRMALTYYTKSGLQSNPSEEVSPTLSDPVAKPEITLLQLSEMDATGERSVLIKWKLLPEHIYRVISQGKTGRELVGNYGLNLYQVKNENSLHPGIRLNDQPLQSGQALIRIGHSTLYARHVDRFGNESEQVFLLHNAPIKTKEDGSP